MGQAAQDTDGVAGKIETAKKKKKNESQLALGFTRDWLLPYGPAVPFLGIHYKRAEILYPHRNLYIDVHDCMVSADEWVNKTW